MRIACTTYFNIAATGVCNKFDQHRIPYTDGVGQEIHDIKQWTRSRNQQRNWETINQLLSLRALPENITLPRLSQDLDPVWQFEFELSSDSAWEKDGDPVGQLKADCVDVPMLLGLGEPPGTDAWLRPDVNVFFQVQDC